MNVALRHCQPDPVGAGRRCTLMKGFLESRSSAAFQVSRRALSNATAMSASLNWRSWDMFYVLSSRGQTWDTSFGLRPASTTIRDSRGFLFRPDRRPYLHCLKLADGGAECHAFLRVVGGAVQRGLSDAERLGCDADSSTVQGLLRRSHTRKRDSGTEARGSHSFPDIIFQEIFLSATETSYHMIHWCSPRSPS